MPNLVVFSGNAHRELAEQVAACLHIPVGGADVCTFSDGEISVEITENVRGKDVFIMQPTCAPTNDNLMEIMVMADALRRSVTPEMERAAEVQLREVVRRVWWVLQPYGSFGESRVTIRRTEDTMKYIRGLPADSTQRATATALRARDAAQTAWRVYATYPLTICGSILGAYGAVATVTAPKKRQS